jgi:choline dehydrogenase
MIESGHSDLKQLFSRIPAGFARLFKTAADHDIRTTLQTNAGGRSMQWPRGKMLGGCSAINAMIYNRGAPDDYNEWEALGNKGWSYKDVKPYMRKAECFNPNSTHELSAEELKHHGRSGPWQTGYSHQTPFTPMFINGCAAQGITKIQDINTDKGINGVSRMQTFIDTKGQRSSAAVAYLTKDVASRPGLKIATGQTVTRIVFDKSGSRPRAVGVEMASSSLSPIRYVAKAKREVLVCAGAVHTPQILKLSGIGPAEELKSHGIDVVKDIPAVGANLVDHLYATLVCKISKGLSLQYMADDILSLPALIQWFRTGKGPMTTNVAEAAAFLRTTERPDAPASLRKNDLTSGKSSADLEILMGPLVFLDHGAIQPPSHKVVRVS